MSVLKRILNAITNNGPQEITWRPEHEALQDSGFEHPHPASKYVPDWYKKIPTSVPGRPAYNEELREYNHTVKNCVPLIDAFTSGFIQELNADLMIQRDIRTGAAIINWPRQFPWEPVRPPRDARAMDAFPAPKGYDPNPYLWIQPFEFGVPEGWSVLITHPLNRFDLPFRTFSAIVDSDSMPMRSEITFYLESGFEGVIPKGTPIFQIIPIKRASWNASLVPYDDKHRIKYVNMTRDVWGGAYRSRFWKKKSYTETKTDVVRKSDEHKDQPKCPVMHGGANDI